ncbi:MBL fold metallo-hydrolase [Yunchengibacter salinarum]|uniref:MBL fold metallo-hydrolase n=1 Tax=Yunchengibacter salinarum TaxID=3133399 RepID=UPI0035B5E10F
MNQPPGTTDQQTPAFGTEDAPVYGTPTPVSDRVRRVLCPNPGPFTYTGTGTFLVDGGASADGTRRGDVAVIDPGPRNKPHLDALIAAIGAQKVSAILVTHTHLDHSPLARPLAEATGAPIHAFGPHGAGQEETALTGESVEEGADKAFAPDHAMADGETVSGTGWTLTALHTPGHTSNHLCFLLTEENLVFTGDHVMGWATTVIVPPDGDMTAYMASLRRLRALAPDKLVPTHGPAIDRPDRFLNAILGHRRQRERQILHHLEAGKSRIADMVAAMYTHVDPALHPAAARSVLAHLVALVKAGRVVADPAPTLDAHYRPAA